MHCVFCGSKQAAAAAPAKTMMGYAGMADDVIAAAKAEREKADAAAAQPQPQAPAAQPQPQAPAAQPQPQPQAAQPPAADPNPDPYGTTQPVDPAGIAQVPNVGAAPPVAPQHAPAPHQPAPGHAQPHAPHAGGAPHAPAYGAPPQAAPQMPPYLASETGTRMNSPQEPWSATLVRVCRGFAIAVGVAFILPWAIPRGSGRMPWTWDMFDARDTGTQLIPVFMLMMIIGAAVAGWVKTMTTTTRGAIAAAVGFAPLIFLGATGFDATQLARGGPGGGFEWRGFALIVGLGVIVGGCLVRSKYPEAMAGRVVATVGALLVILPYLVPVHGQIPLAGLFTALGEAPGMQKLLALYMIGGFVLGVLALLAWMPPATTAGAGAVALGAMLYLPIAIWAAVVAMSSNNIGDSFRMIGLWYHFPVVLLSAFALGGYGLATLLGKQLEHA